MHDCERFDVCSVGEIMENQKASQTLLLKSVGKAIRELGFRQNLSSQVFHRQTHFGKQSLHISFIPHKEDLDITADVAIRFDLLEEFLFDFLDTRFLSERDKKSTFSFGSELGRINGEGQMRWTIVSDSDVETESEKIVSCFKRIGLPYLEQYSDMCRIFDVIALLSRESELLNGVPEKQARNAVALAYLCNKGKETFELVVDRMTSYLTPIPNANIGEFNRVVEAISQKTMDQENVEGRVTNRSVASTINAKQC